MIKKAFACPQKPFFVNIKRSETGKEKIIFGKRRNKIIQNIFNVHILTNYCFDTVSYI